jgi:hypothetical protein
MMAFLRDVLSELAFVPVWAWWVITCLACALWGALMQVPELTTDRRSTTFAARSAALIVAAAVGILVPLYLWLAEWLEAELGIADPMTRPDPLDKERI